MEEEVNQGRPLVSTGTCIDRHSCTHIFLYNTGKKNKGVAVRRKRDFLEALARPQSCLCCLTKFPELPLAFETTQALGEQSLGAASEHLLCYFCLPVISTAFINAACLLAFSSLIVKP